MTTEKLEIFRPKNFQEYIGQDKAKNVAKVIVDAATIQRRAIPNTLIDGTYGLGKTTLARVMRFEAGDKHPQIVDASAINKGTAPLGSRPIIIDEIHNLDPVIADSLNVLMDRGGVSIIGCTTNPGALSSAFRSRFRSIHLEPYTDRDIFMILQQAISKLGRLLVSPKEVTSITQRSRANPRVALNNLAFMMDFAAVEMSDALTPHIVNSAFKTLGIDEHGFTDRDYAYMNALPDDRPVGIQYLSAMTGVDSKTIESEIEPYLMQTGMIDRMPRGRIKLKDL